MERNCPEAFEKTMRNKITIRKGKISHESLVLYQLGDFVSGYFKSTSEDGVDFYELDEDYEIVIKKKK